MKINIENLSIKYDEKIILRDLNLSIKEGEFVSVLGKSGSGKTTLLNIISGTVKPDRGKVLIDENEVREITSKVAYMPQDDLLLPWKNVIDNVILYGRINGKKEEARKEALKNMEAFGLKGYEYSYPDELSGGMRQRAAFLRTALCPADTLLLDEPFASLDVLTRREMQIWFSDMKSRFNKTVLLVTHDIDEALILSDRIIVLAQRPAIVKEEFILTKNSSNFSHDKIKEKIRKILYKDI